MAEVKQEVIEISNPGDKINEETDFSINQFEVTDALIVTGKEQPKKYTVYPVLD
ncbi:hypothetical protein AAEO57_09545 [Flavobacterium sp. DGU38]|uniref:Uncharacterized protein n=1 Tax=Flavobacterium calami TaxID=3139144 RepID=A0ABU9IPC2_9FLAO